MMSPFVVFTFSNAEASAADGNTHADRQTVALRIFQNVLENRKIGVEIEVVKTDSFSVLVQPRNLV